MVLFFLFLVFEVTYLESFRIGGYDIATEMNMVHQLLGVCPQFDTLWNILTVKETILFYARLKGATKGSVLLLFFSKHLDIQTSE
jgi:ABC-type multidrug transport system ATPase subunit